MKIDKSCSLIISTYNWPAALSLCLKSVFRQTLLPNEIIIADDGSTEDTKRLIDELRIQSPVPITHVWHEDKGFRKTLVMNKAIKQAKYDYIIEVDGDIILHKKFIADHIKSAKKGHFISGNRAYIEESLTSEVLKSGRIDFSFFTKGMRKRHYAIRMPFWDKIFKVSDTHFETVLGCNLSFWKSDFLAVNGYNNEINGWGSEDIEFVIRLIKYGKKCTKLRFSANEYHIYHPCSSLDRREDNHRIFLSTKAASGYTCANGANQVD